MLLLRIAPDQGEGFVAAVAVLAEKVVSDADVSGVFGCGVIVGEVDARLVVFVDRDRSSDELARDALDDVDQPE